MGLKSVELRQHGQRATAVDVLGGEHGERHEHLVGVQAGIVSAQIVHLGLLNGLDEVLREQLLLVADAGQIFHRVEQQRSAGAQQRAASGGDDGAVFQLDGRRLFAALFGALLGGHGGGAVVGGDLGLLEQQGYLVDFGFVHGAAGHLAQGGVVATDDFLLGGILTHLVVGDAEAHHVDAHVRGALVGAFAVDAVEDGGEHGEDLHVAVVVDGHLAVGLHVEGVDLVHVVEVGRSGFVGDVDGMLQGEVPHGEGLKLGVSGVHAALVLVVELREAYGHLAAAGTGCGDDDQRLRGLHVVVLAEALVAVDEGDVVGIAFDGVVVVGADAEALQTLAVAVGAALPVVVGDDDGAHFEASVVELRAQAQYIFIISDAQILAHLVALDVYGRDDDDDFGFVGQLGQHAQLGVGQEAGQDAAGVVVVEELAAELQVKFAFELSDALFDVFALDANVFVVVETVFHLVG